jgi:hypothetical protein
MTQKWALESALQEERALREAAHTKIQERELELQREAAGRSTDVLRYQDLVDTLRQDIAQLQWDLQKKSVEAAQWAKPVTSHVKHQPVLKGRKKLNVREGATEFSDIVTVDLPNSVKEVDMKDLIQRVKSKCQRHILAEH